VATRIQYSALENQMRKLQRMLSKKIMECAILREAISRVVSPPKQLCAQFRRQTATCKRGGKGAWVSLQYLTSARGKAGLRRRGRAALPEQERLARIEALIADLPTHGYCRIHVLLRRQACKGGVSTLHARCAQQVMKAHGLLLQRGTSRSTTSAGVPQARDVCKKRY
jgi:hypothetical protein